MKVEKIKTEKKLFREMLGLVEDFDEVFENLDVYDFSDDSPNGYSSESETFMVGNNKYVCDYNLSLTRGGKSVLEFKFKLKVDDKKINRSNFKSDVQYQIALQKSQTGITGDSDGKQFKIFRLVLAHLIRWVTKNKPNYVTFVASEENRQKLYSAFLKRYSNKLPEYKLCDKNPLTDEKLEPEEFWLKFKNEN